MGNVPFISDVVKKYYFFLCFLYFDLTGGAHKLLPIKKPMTDLNKIITAQEQTAAAFTRIVKKGIPSFSGCYAVSDSLKRLEIGSALSAPELLRIGKLLQTTARIKSYGRHENADDQADCLDVYFEQLAPLTPLSAEIDRCILGEDEISDDASSKLKQIRRSINGMNDKIHSTMTGLLNGSMRTYLQDAIITMRGDRYCLPVKAEYRSQVNGLIHDQSATGSTLFIEPMAVVKLNNDLKELYAQEQEEIQVILARLSVDAAEYIEEIRLNYKALVELDFIFAKGALALDMNASRPVFNTEGRIRIREGRHPLLDRFLFRSPARQSLPLLRSVCHGLVLPLKLICNSVLPHNVPARLPVNLSCSHRKAFYVQYLLK